MHYNHAQHLTATRPLKPTLTVSTYMYVRNSCYILWYTFNIQFLMYIRTYMYINTYKSYCMYDVCMYNASYHPSLFLPALNVVCHLCMCLLTCTPQLPLPTTPAQASVDEKSGEVRQLQDTVRQLQEEQRNKDSVSPSSSAVALSSGQQRKTLLSLRRPRTAVTELVSTYVRTYMLPCLQCLD